MFMKASFNVSLSALQTKPGTFANNVEKAQSEPFRCDIQPVFHSVLIDRRANRAGLLI